MTNGEKFFETFGNDVPNFRLKAIVAETGIPCNFIAFLSTWWYDNYKEGTPQND